jgi:hypothetical protein
VQGGSPSVSDTGGPSYSNTAPGGGGNTSGSGLPDGPGWIALNYVIATGNMP